MNRTVLFPRRLDQLHRVLSAYVERREIPGMVALVSCLDDVHIEVLGTMAFGSPTPMRRDTIFRIASLSKLATAVAAMILVEECRLRLDESIEPWLPELANRRVLRSLAAELDDTTPAQRAITVRDLLTYRMGFGSVMAPPESCPIQRPIRDLQIGGDGPPRPALLPPADEWLRRLGSLPWIAQPGERWLYHVSCDVLGVLIARVSGKSLGAFLRERIFQPLGMRDTAFHVPGAKLDRLPPTYAFDHAQQALAVFDGVEDSAWQSEPPFESGGGGLVSTIDDFFAFCRMLLAKGRHGDERILAPTTVELMTADQLTPEQRIGAELFFGGYRSWGLGMAVDTRANEIFRVPGRFGWDGGFGTSAYIDPANKMIGILFTQRMMESPEPPDVYKDFWTLAYAARA
jgi:CubicO group peptidase (beta-lactamase class C family)